MYHPYLNLCCLCLCLLYCASASAREEEEVGSLVEFKKGIREDPLGLVVNSWNRSRPLWTWHGIRCEEEQSGSVTAILLDDLGLVGDLKLSTLTPLKSLANLSLSGNYLTGRIVPAIGSISTLLHLDLSRNLFYGPIPARITDLWNLHYLNLSSNNLTGGLPLAASFHNLHQLAFLDLHSNALWADLADLFSNLTSPLQLVDFSSNLFYGGLGLLDPNQNLFNTLIHLNLSHNSLNGLFFSQDCINMFTHLQVLDLANNHLRGQLPSSLTLPSLHFLSLANNMLYGSIPQQLLHTSTIPLQHLDLSNNAFSGSIHAINSTTFNLLNLSSNRLSGPLPSYLQRCRFLDLSANNLSGDLFPIHNWGDTLSTLDLSINHLSASIPSTLFTSATLTHLNLSANHFTGTIPPFQPSSHSQLHSLDLSNNYLTGSLPSNIAYLGMTLTFLYLQHNTLSGHLPTQITNLTLLESLDLSTNNFTGNIPQTLPPSLKHFNVSYNHFSGPLPPYFTNFPLSSFQPGNTLLIFPTHHHSPPFPNTAPQHHNSKSSIRVAIIVASLGAALMILFVLLAYYRARFHHFHARRGFTSHATPRDLKLPTFTRPSLFNFQRNSHPPPTSFSFSNHHLLTSNSRSISGHTHFVTQTAHNALPDPTLVDAQPRKSDVLDIHLPSAWRSSPATPLPSPPNLIETCEQSAVLNVYSPDRLAGDLFFLDNSLVFTPEELSHAPAEVLGRSSHGTLYKATLHNGHVLTVKWLRVGLVKHKKEFSKEAKKIGFIRHPNIVPLRACYWGPREQERLILADYVGGDSLSLHLYESTPRRYPRLSFSQRLKIVVDVALCLCHLHDKGLPHGNLKPTNVLLTGPDLTARLTDYGLHRLMTPAGTAEQLLNLRALGYGAPELANVPKPLPSFKADVYALGVILMELLTRRSAGDIISGQTGAVDLTDWVRLCAHEGRGMDCFDRDISGGEEPSKAMDDFLATSLKCILPVNERPSIRTVFEDLCSISV